MDNDMRDKGNQSARLKGMNPAGKRLLGGLVHNIWWKLLSLLLAILLWNYIISTNTSITRSKIITGLTGYVTGQTTLSANRLALLDDPSSQLNDIAVTVDVPQTYYNRLGPGNVQVSLDLSNVRTAGEKVVPLRATCTYGRVTQIDPDSISLMFEAQDSRVVPVNIIDDTKQRDNDYWYRLTGKNPGTITVSGAASVVRSIASAEVHVDLKSFKSSTTLALPYKLMDTSAKEVSQEMLNLSSSSVTVEYEVYPRKLLPVSTEISKAVVGTPAFGYQVKEVTIDPETVWVAADAKWLEENNELRIVPISVEGAKQNVSQHVDIDKQSEIQYISSDKVYATVTIEESIEYGYANIRDVVWIGKGPGLNAKYDPGKYPFRYVTNGPSSEIKKLQQEGLVVELDITGKGVGTHRIKPVIDLASYPNVTFTTTTDTVTVEITEIGTD